MRQSTEMLEAVNFTKLLYDHNNATVKGIVYTKVNIIIRDRY